MEGILYPGIQGMLGGEGIDPRTLGILQAGLGIMAAGPGRSLGQAIGMGGMQGLGAYQQAAQQQRKDSHENLKMMMEMVQLRKLMEAEELKKKILSSIPGMPGYAGPTPQQASPQGGLSPSSAAAIGAPWAANEPQASPTASPQGGGFPFSPNAIAAMKLAGLPDLTDTYKIANPDLEFKDGVWYDKKTGMPVRGGAFVNQQGFGGQMNVGPGGRISVAELPGAAALYRNQQQIGEDVRAGSDLVKVDPISAQDPPTYKTRAQIRDAAMGRNAPPQADNSGVDFNLDGVRGTAASITDAENLYKRMKGISELTPPVSGAPAEAPKPAAPANVAGMSPMAQAAQDARANFAKALSGQQAQQMEEYRVAADAAAKAKASINYQMDLIGKGMFGGKLAPGVQGAVEFLNGFGVLPEGSVKEAMQGGINFKKVAEEQALSQIKMFVGSQNISDADRKAVASIVAKMEDDPQARLQYLNFLQHRADEAINKYSAASAYAKKEMGLTGFQYAYKDYVPSQDNPRATGAKEFPLALPARKDASTLTKDKWYRTPKGILKWDGFKFVSE